MWLWIFLTDQPQVCETSWVAPAASGSWYVRWLRASTPAPGWGIRVKGVSKHRGSTRFVTVPEVDQENFIRLQLGVYAPLNGDVSKPPFHVLLRSRFPYPDGVQQPLFGDVQVAIAENQKRISFGRAGRGERPPRAAGDGEDVYYSYLGQRVWGHVEPGAGAVDRVGERVAELMRRGPGGEDDGEEVEPPRIGDALSTSPRDRKLHYYHFDSLSRGEVLRWLPESLRTQIVSFAVTDPWVGQERPRVVVCLTTTSPPCRMAWGQHRPRAGFGFVRAAWPTSPPCWIRFRVCRLLFCSPDSPTEV